MIEFGHWSREKLREEMKKDGISVNKHLTKMKLIEIYTSPRMYFDAETDIIPMDLWYYMAVYFLDLKDVFALSRTAKRFNKLLCANNQFWKERVQIELGGHSPGHSGSWKMVYKTSIE